MTACSGSAFPHDEPDHEPAAVEEVAVDPIKACEMLIAAPRGLAQQKAAEHGCVEVGDNVCAIMDRIIHNTIWVETGNYNMREHAALISA